MTLRFSRRALLQWAGIGIGTSITGCRAEARASSASDDLTGAEWGELGARLRGRLILPEEPSFQDARLSYNPLADDHLPSAVAQCAAPEDVQACIAFARTKSIKVAARSG